MGSAKEADETDDGDERPEPIVSDGKDGMGLVETVLLAALLWFTVPVVYPPLLDLIGADPTDDGVISVEFMQVLVASYPLFSYAIDRTFGDHIQRQSSANPTDVMMSIPQTAHGSIRNTSDRHIEIDQSVTEEYVRETPPEMHSEWKIETVARERVNSGGMATCAATGNRIPLSKEHLLVQAAYNPAGLSSTSRVWFRVRNEDALEEWFDE